jgi:hypothetical protein
MNDQALFELVGQIDPLPGLARIGHPPRELLEQVLAAPREERSAKRTSRWTRIAFVVVALALGAVGAGLALAGTGWLTGSPAPPAVVTDFQAYTPQLGFHPDPGGAVLVAEEGQVKLYATTDRERTYCLVLADPWKPATTLDGGVCLPQRIASAHFIAGIIGGSPPSSQGTTTLVVAGRIADTRARAVRFSGPDGKTIERPVGPNGFFVVAVTSAMPCEDGDWSSTFTALDGGGNEVAQTAVALTMTTQRNAQGRVRVCLIPSLTPATPLVPASR